LRERIASAKRVGKSIGLVPTMGALHAGHRSLLATAGRTCDIVVMSLFVNPTQFNDKDDFTKYPRDPAADEETARAEGVDFVFAPEPAEIYPPGFATFVSVPGISDRLEGASRPGHFAGVATVVSKLLLIAGCDKAFFGMKDYQQLQVIRRMVADLNIPTEIVACPTLREADGLAMSSRNVRLTPDQRAAAVVISRALHGAADLVASGERDAKLIQTHIAKIIHAEPLAKLDYAVIADPDNLTEISTIDKHAVALVAAWFGSVRLIDNMVLVGHANQT
jgi:pantoate--beta-alanine ligase